MSNSSFCSFFGSFSWEIVRTYHGSCDRLDVFAENTMWWDKPFLCTFWQVLIASWQGLMKDRDRFSGPPVNMNLHESECESELQNINYSHRILLFYINWMESFQTRCCIALPLPIGPPVQPDIDTTTKRGLLNSTEQCVTFNRQSNCMDDWFC